MSLPSRTKRYVREGRERGHRRLQPRRPALRHGLRPSERIRWPSWMPNGIETSTVRSSTDWPAPLQTEHGVSTIWPAPPQRDFACARTRRTRCATPGAGFRLRRTSGRSPGSSRARRHFRRRRPHVTATASEIGRSTPLAASTSSIVHLGADICATPPSPAARSEQIVSEERERGERSLMSPRSKLGTNPRFRSPSWPKRSSSARRSGLDSTSYASTSSFNRSSASGASETSGWCSRASVRNAFLIASSPASPPERRAARSSRGRPPPSVLFEDAFRQLQHSPKQTKQ